MCPTCSHTMQDLGIWFWCSRCGTLKPKHFGQAEAPKLVTRVKDLLHLGHADEEAAHRLGVTESVFPASDRVKGAHVDGERRANE